MQRWIMGIIALVPVGFSAAQPLSAGLRIEVQTLSSEPVQGELLSLESGVLKLSTGKGEQSFPQQDVLAITPIRSTAVVPTTPEEGAQSIALEFVDGSSLQLKSLELNLQEVTVDSVLLGKRSIAAPSIRTVRFGDGNSTLQEKWNALRERENKKDLLVIYKGDSIDFVDGIIGGITPAAVQFLLDGEEIPVNREKVYGIIFQRPVATAPHAGWLQLRNGDRLNVTDVRLDQDRFFGTSSQGFAVDVSLDEVGAIDFRAGRLTYLSDLEPSVEEYTPFFDTVWKIRRDRNYDGGPLRIGGRSFSKGLCIHSRTQVSYRLLGDYRRFQAWIGIDELVASRGDVQVVIKADDKVVFEGTVKGTDAPQRIDADVSGARNLDILVDFGGDLDISDHLDLADARLVK